MFFLKNTLTNDRFNFVKIVFFYENTSAGKSQNIVKSFKNVKISYRNRPHSSLVLLFQSSSTLGIVNPCALISPPFAAVWWTGHLNKKQLFVNILYFLKNFSVFLCENCKLLGEKPKNIFFQNTRLHYSRAAKTVKRNAFCVFQVAPYPPET